MTTTFDIEVFSPTGLEFSDVSEAVTLPTNVGEVGILPGHIKYAGLLGTGILEYRSSRDGEVKRLVVSGGFCNFSADKLVILADSVDAPESIDRESYGTERESLAEFISEGHMDDLERVHAREKLARIEAIDRLISH